MKKITLFILFYIFSTSSYAQSFLGTPIKWTTLIQNEAESSEPNELTATVYANNIISAFTLNLGEQVIVAHIQNLNDGWVLTSIKTSTGEINWKSVVTKTTDGIRSLPTYLYQSSSTTIDLIGYEMTLDTPNSFGEIGYLFRSKISLIDGSILETDRPKEEDGGTFLLNANGVPAKMVHRPENDSFFLAEHSANYSITPTGMWKLVEADSNCLQLSPPEYLTATNTSNDAYQYQALGLSRTEDDGYMLLLRELNDSGEDTNYVELVKLNEEKEVQWKKNIVEDIGTEGFLVPSNSSGYMIYGNLNAGTNPSDSYISKFDENGNILWIKTIGTENRLRYGTALITEEGYLLGGIRDKQEAFLLKCDEEGNINEVANWKVSGEGDEQKMRFERAIELQNGDLMAFMYVYRDTIINIASPFGGTITSDIGKNYIALIEKDDLTTDIEGVQEYDTVLQLSPNPSSDFVQLSFPQTVEGVVRFYNTQGQLLKSVAIRKEQTKSVSIGDLTDGLYFVQWEDADKTMTTQSLLIQR
ncbi:MAG: T9SS type A sorting domain-containing protein [Chitinophagales bacterium]